MAIAGAAIRERLQMNNTDTTQPNVPVEHAGANRSGLPLLSLLPFLLITFVIAWVILALYIFLPDHMAGFFGHLTRQHPLFFLAV